MADVRIARVRPAFPDLTGAFDAFQTRRVEPSSAAILCLSTARYQHSCPVTVGRLGTRAIGFAAVLYSTETIDTLSGLLDRFEVIDAIAGIRRSVSR